MEGAVDAFGCKECNIHLVVLVIDRIILGLWPELGVGGMGVGDEVRVGNEGGHEKNGESNGKNSGVATPVTPPRPTRPFGL